MTDWKRQCAAVIPCFNEAGRIAPVISGVRRHLPRVVVVDDGSSDATPREAALAGAEVIRQPANGGKGSALRKGWAYACQMGCAWVLSMDGDGQHAAEDIPEFFACAERTGARLIVGNRMQQDGAMPWLRRWANRGMSWCLSEMTGAALPDSQCGFRLGHLANPDATPPVRFAIRDRIRNLGGHSCRGRTGGICPDPGPLQIQPEQYMSLAGHLALAALVGGATDGPPIRSWTTCRHQPDRLPTASDIGCAKR